MLADGAGRNTEGEGVGLSKWSCCGSAANNLNIYFLYLGQNLANSSTGKQLYTHEWSCSIQDTSLIANKYPRWKNMREITQFGLGGWSNPGGAVLIGGRALETVQLKGIMRQHWLEKKQKSGIQRVTNV